MAGKRRPMDVNLSVVEGGGGKHWTKAEVEARKASEPKLPKPKALKPPDWLSDPAKKLFKNYAKQLLEFPSGIISTLDVGTLAKHCDNEHKYAEASQKAEIWAAREQRYMDEYLRLKDETAPWEDIRRARDEYAEAQDKVKFYTELMVKHEKMARSNATEMGMTVSSRCRLVVPKSDTKEEADPLAELQKRLFGS